MATKLKQLKLDELSLVDNPANKSARVTIFKRDADPGEAEDFLTKVVEIQKRDRCSRLVALTKAPDEFPAEFEAYQEQQLPSDPKFAAIAKGHARQANIDRRLREMMKRDNINRMEALHSLHDEQPEIFEDSTN